MAVDLDPTLLVKPDGELSSRMVSDIAENREPAASYPLVLAGFADAGAERVKLWTDDTVALRGAVAWAYYAAFSERADQILSGAMSAQAAGEGGESWSAAQAKELLERAELWKAVYEAAETGLGVYIQPRSSRQVLNVFRW